MHIYFFRKKRTCTNVYRKVSRLLVNNKSTKQMGSAYIGTGYMVALKKQPSDNSCCWMGFVSNRQRGIEQLMRTPWIQDEMKFLFYVNYAQPNWDKQAHHHNQMAQRIQRFIRKCSIQFDNENVLLAVPLSALYLY